MDEQTPAFAEEMIEDLENQIAELEATLRRKKVTLAGVKGEYRPNDQTSLYTQQKGRMTRQTVDLGACPLSVEEMRNIGDRYAIIWEITGREPQGEVTTAHAAEWLNRAGIVKTNRTNLTKTLNRALRKDPRYVEIRTGTFRRRELNREQANPGHSPEPNSSDAPDNGGENQDPGTT